MINKVVKITVVERSVKKDLIAKYGDPKLGATDEEAGPFLNGLRPPRTRPIARDASSRKISTRCSRKYTIMPNWDVIYNEQKLDLPVLPTVDEAIAWANDLIARIVAS